MDFFNMIASLEEQARIARQRGRITGDINDSLDPQGRQQLRRLRAQARARRIDDYQLRLHVEAPWQKSFYWAQHRDNILDRIRLEVGGRGRRGLHGKDLIETLGKMAGKQPDPRKEI